MTSTTRGPVARCLFRGHVCRGARSRRRQSHLSRSVAVQRMHEVEKPPPDPHARRGTPVPAGVVTAATTSAALSVIRHPLFSAARSPVMIFADRLDFLEMPKHVSVSDPITLHRPFFCRNLNLSTLPSFRPRFRSRFLPAWRSPTTSGCPCACSSRARSWWQRRQSLIACPTRRRLPLWARLPLRTNKTTSLTSTVRAWACAFLQGHL